MPIYPSLDVLNAGGSVPNSKDALGRMSLRTNMAPKNFGDQAGDQLGGMPQMKGPEHMVPHLLEAAARLKFSPRTATGPQTMSLIRSLGTVPQVMAKQLGTSDPKEQAVAILKRSLNV